MKLRDEFLEFIHERWTRISTRILVSIAVIIAIYSAIISRLDILWVSIYVFVIIFFILNALYIMLAREQAPIIPGKELVVKRVAKFSLLVPYARIGLIVSLVLIPLFGFVAPFSQPVKVLLNGTPTYTPTITLTPTQTLTPTETSTATPTSTLTPTATPKTQGVYYMIVLDASANMTRAFDGKTQWEAARDSVNAILAGLEPGASYGLVTVGGSASTEGVDPCSEPSALRSFFAPRQKVSEQIAQLQPVGGGSLSTAFALAKNQFEGLAENTVRILIYVTGSSDACKSQNEWQALDGLLSQKDNVGEKFYTEIIVLDENVDAAVQSTLEKIDDRSADVDVQLPKNFTVLQQAYPTLVNDLNTYIKDTIASYPTETPVPSATMTATPRVVTPSLTPTITVTPSITPTFGAPTTVLTWTPTITPVTPSATTVPATSVKLLSVTYLTQGVGCQIDVQVSVDGGPATGTFHVRNDSYAPGDSTASPQTTLQVGTNYASSFGFSNLLTLSGDKPIYYTHEIWFDYNGIQSNHLTNLFCPGIPPP